MPGIASDPTVCAYGRLFRLAVARLGLAGRKFLLPFDTLDRTVLHKHGYTPSYRIFTLRFGGEFQARSAAFRWRNTAAISRISLDFDNGQWIYGQWSHWRYAL